MNRIGIIGAMDEELSLLKQRAQILDTKTIAGLTFDIARLFQKDIIMVKCGIGKVNAAICTQALIGGFGVDAVVNVGIAGAVYQGLSIGDIVISTDTVQHDMDTTAFGDPIGLIPRMQESYFKADETLRGLALQAAKSLSPSLNTFQGRIASGDQFIASVEGKKRIWDTVQGYCAEMEGAAIAQACYLNQTPFVLIRAISDNAEGGSTADYEAFTAQAADNAGNLLLKMIEKMD